MHMDLCRWLIVSTAIIAVAGGAVAVVYFFQPWRSCDYEDSSVGCAMLPADSAVMTGAAFAALISTALLVIALLAKEQRPAR